MFLKSAIVLALSVQAFAAEGGSNPGGLTVHEWGTFTSVAGLNGSPVYWSPLSGPSDLPCFVNRRPALLNVKSFGTLVRMETPVLYFYSPVKTTLSVHVGFPQGLISEWYPKAAKALPDTANVNTQRSEIEWGPVEVLPGENLTFPTGKGASHYYAARNTDAAPIRIGDQQEKLIFYRGVGTFPIPLHPTFTSEGRLQVRNTSSQPIPAIILFENRDGKAGFRVVSHPDSLVTMDTPDLSGDSALLRKNLAATLTELGLYRKEAEAMVKTWRDSWFEEGMRLFYFVPRATVDNLLPLTIKPAPAATERVFVGRVEILSPSIRQSLETAFTNGDTAVLEKYGRFLDPFLSEIRGVRDLPRVPATEAFLASKYGELNRERTSPSCIQ